MLICQYEARQLAFVAKYIFTLYRGKLDWAFGGVCRCGTKDNGCGTRCLGVYPKDDFLACRALWNRSSAASTVREPHNEEIWLGDDIYHERHRNYTFGIGLRVDNSLDYGVK